MLAVTFGMSRLEHLCIRYLEVIINLKNVLVNNFEIKLYIDYFITMGIQILDQITQSSLRRTGTVDRIRRTE